MAKILGRCVCLYILCICIFLTSITASAVCPLPISDLYTDGTTGWNIINGGHMGYKCTSFRFDDVEDLEEYHDEIRAGIALWGNYITCVESSNAHGLFKLDKKGDRDYLAEAKPIPILDVRIM